MELVQHTESDAWLALSLATHLNLLPLSCQLSCITGYLWSRTLQACLHAPHLPPLLDHHNMHESLALIPSRWQVTLLSLQYERP